MDINFAQVHWISIGKSAKCIRLGFHNIFGDYLLWILFLSWNQRKFVGSLLQSNYSIPFPIINYLLSFSINFSIWKTKWLTLFFMHLFDYFEKKAWTKFGQTYQPSSLNASILPIHHFDFLDLSCTMSIFVLHLINEFLLKVFNQCELWYCAKNTWNDFN